MIASLLGLLIVAWFIVRRPLGAFALIFLLVTFIWRLGAAGYLDAMGPLYSYEAERMVGGGIAAEFFGIAIILTIAVMAYIFRPSYFAGKVSSALRLSTASSKGFSLGDGVFWLSALYVIGLFADMLLRGAIPLFDCMERYEYLFDYAGPLHMALFKYGPLIALQLGTFCVYPRLRGESYDYRFLLLLVVLLFYSALTGSRFSAFYSLSLFFITPFSLVLALKLYDDLPSREKRPTLVGRLLNHPLFLAFLGLVSVAIVSFTMVHSYANVRAEGGCKDTLRWMSMNDPKVMNAPMASAMNAPMASAMNAPMASAMNAPMASAMNAPMAQKRVETLNRIVDTQGTLARFLDPKTLFRIEQRILVQPIHMWFMTWDRVVERHDRDPAGAFDFVFDNDHAREGNRSIQYLMSRTLPAERAAYLKSVGNQFAGGYPEIFYELLGPWVAWLAIALFAGVTALLLRHWLLSVLRGHFLTAFFAAYVYYAFLVMYIGGMLNFLIVSTFWTKVALLAFFSWYELRRSNQGRPLMPWRIGR
jgi:hypothetical protein